MLRSKKAGGIQREIEKLEKLLEESMASPEKWEEFRQKAFRGKIARLRKDLVAGEDGPPRGWEGPPG